MYCSTAPRVNQDVPSETTFLRNNLEFFFLKEPTIEKIHYPYLENTKLKIEFPDYFKENNYYRKCIDNTNCFYCINKYTSSYIFNVPIFNTSCNITQNLTGSLYALQKLLNELDFQYGESSNPEDYIYFAFVFKLKDTTRYHFRIKPK
jgi:hypothetical protein